MNRRRRFAAGARARAATLATAALTCLVALTAWASSSCSPASFQSETVIDGVRILASRATEPRAKPGDPVTVDVLAIDGRLVQPAPMQVFWLPVPCLNPAGDAYYACFSQFLGDGGTSTPTPTPTLTPTPSPSADGGDDAGAGNASPNLAALLRPGVDLTPVLVTGPSFNFTVPREIIIERTGVSPSYGLVILFNIACAGHLELVPFDPNSSNPQNIPLGCFDANEHQLGPQDYVIGFTRVYVFAADPVEVNPVISQVDLGGSQLAIDGGVTTAPFTPPLCIPNKKGDCPDNAIGPIVAQSAPTTKQVWADFYSTIGTFKSEARLLFEPGVSLAIPSGTNNDYRAPTDLTGAPPPGENFVWIVVHDDQGGADWVTVPLQVSTSSDLDAGLDGGGPGDH